LQPFRPMSGAPAPLPRRERALAWSQPEPFENSTRARMPAPVTQPLELEAFPALESFVPKRPVVRVVSRTPALEPFPPAAEPLEVQVR
jgi:hypothetical protein